MTTTGGTLAAGGATPEARSTPGVAGRIGVTLLCCYLFAVAVRIGGCYRAEPTPRDDAIDAGPRLGAPFPPFALPDVTGVRVTLQDLAGRPAIVAFVPSLDWSAPTKARILDLAEAVGRRRDLTLTIILTTGAATPRSLTFVREHHLPAYVLVDGTGFTEGLGLQIAGPEGIPVALPATFVLDANGTVLARDVRRDPRTWLDAAAVLAAARVPAEPPP